MQENPSYYNRNVKSTEPKLRVTLVTQNGDGAAEDVASFCKDKNVVFMAREYNKFEYSEDCEQIARLPAFHIYEINSNVYLSTFYPTEDPNEHIQQQLEALKEREAVEKARREAWMRRMSYLSGLFRLPSVQLPRLRKSKSLSSLSPTS